jgi:hypothetical protein
MLLPCFSSAAAIIQAPAEPRMSSPLPVTDGVAEVGTDCQPSLR